MHGALVLLTALVLSGFASGAHAALPRVQAEVPACATTRAGVEVLVADEDRVSEETPGQCVDSAGFRWERGQRAAHRQAGEVATPAVIGCALVFAHARPTSPPEARPWSCEESGRVYNLWYRVSRTPESESGRLVALASLERTSPEATSGARWSSEAPGPRAPGLALLDVPILPAAGSTPPAPVAARVAHLRARVRLILRPLAPPDRPPRAV